MYPHVCIDNYGKPTPCAAFGDICAVNFMELFTEAWSALLQTGPWELAAVIGNIAYLLLAYRGHPLCWPVGILAAGITIYLNIIGTIYLEALLNSYYVLIGFYGWFAWTRKDEKRSSTRLPVSRMTAEEHLLSIGLGFLLVLLFGRLFQLIGSERSYLDAFTTVFSFITTYWLSRKKVENWLYWIVIDFASIFLYQSRGYSLYALLFLVFTVVAIFGFFRWKKEMETSPAL